MTDVEVGQRWRIRDGRTVVIDEIEEPWTTSSGQTGIAKYHVDDNKELTYSCWLGGRMDKKDGASGTSHDLIELLRSPERRQTQLQLL